jgi:signal transduction histidine kinase
MTEVTQAIDILLVDDEPRNLDALEAILEDPAYRLVRASSADQALRILLEHDVAAIVLDIKMPGMSGFELAQLIKSTKKFRQVPILFLTAYLLGDQDVIAGYGAGAVDYLTKPINPQILRAKVAVFADLFRKTRALAELNEKLEERVRERTADLEKSESALRSAGEQKDEFLAVLAHELRNPLAPLRTGLDLLLAAPDRPPAPRTLAAMNRQLDHMVRLIDDLLDISRISRGVLELKKQRVDLAEVLHAALDSAKPFFERKHVTVSVDAPLSVLAYADPTRVAQIVGNLLHNSAKFTSDGGRIDVTLVARDGTAVVRVVDTGVGIPPDQLEHVFDMFARVDRGSRADQGLGIGLALARRLAEMHGGTLVATSGGEGQGAALTLTLPSLAPADAGVTRESRSRRAPERLLRIAIIEDNDDVADTLADLLGQLGHDVHVARTGRDGVALVQADAPDVVLCDLGLPGGMDGLDVCRAVRALPLATQPVMVALTGWGREDDRRRTSDAGFDRHLVKPIGLDPLQEILRAV